MSKTTLWTLAGCLGVFAYTGVAQLHAGPPPIPRDYYSKDNPLWPLDRVDVRPEPIEQKRPVLPPKIEALKGSVVVTWIINKTGSVEFPYISKSSDRRLDKPTLEAVKKWQFKPATKAGKPANCLVSQQLDFN